MKLFEGRKIDALRCVGWGWTDDIDDTNTNNAGPVTCSPGVQAGIAPQCTIQSVGNTHKRRRRNRV